MIQCFSIFIKCAKSPLIPEYFKHLQKQPFTVKQSIFIPVLPPAPVTHYSIFYFYALPILTFHINGVIQ